LDYNENIGEFFTPFLFVTCEADRLCFITGNMLSRLMLVSRRNHEPVSGQILDAIKASGGAMGFSYNLNKSFLRMDTNAPFLHSCFNYPNLVDSMWTTSNSASASAANCYSITNSGVHPTKYANPNT
jgi:hypothetical protein